MTRLLTSLVLAAALAACGDSSTSTSENRAPSARISSDPITVREGAEHTTTVTLSGSLSSDPDGDALSFLWDVPGGTFVEGTSAVDESVRVEFPGSSPHTISLEVSDGRGGQASAQLTLELGTGLTRFQKDYVEALFLGSGRLIPQDGAVACMGALGRWASFPEGTDVEVLVSSTIDVSGFGEDTQQFIRDALGDIPLATDGWLAVTFMPTADPDPIPGDGQVSSTDHPDPTSVGCAFDRGCTLSGWRDPNDRTILSWARAVQRESTQPANAIVHDVVGHGVMGLCHIDQALIGGSQNSLMSGGPGAFSGDIAPKLSELDLVAIRAVYQARLGMGATRIEFLAADLVNP